MRINYRFVEPQETFGYEFREPCEKYNAGFNDSMSITPVTDYANLKNKPQINSVELVGSLSLPELGLRAIYYDSTANWDSNVSMIGEEGVLYIYSDAFIIEDEAGNITYLAGIKVGDGSAYLVDIPFVTDATTSMLLNHINNTEIHITQAERAFWNNKVSAYLESEETLALSKTHYELNGEIVRGI